MVPLEKPQAHYLGTVLRLKAGERVLVFNGREGEWSATLQQPQKRTAALLIEENTRPQAAPADLKILRKPFDTVALRGFIADTMAVDLAS